MKKDNKDCIFCKIAKKEVPTKIIYEDDWVMAFPDIHPLVPIHILIIPKKHIASANDLTEDEKNEKIVGRMILTAVKIAKKMKIAEDGYKMLIRTGKNGGQEVPHIHLHLLGGGKMKENIGLINSKKN